MAFNSNPKWHSTFIGVCIQHLEKLLHAATIKLSDSDFDDIMCDACEIHKPGYRARCKDCRQWKRACKQHSRGFVKSCTDCRSRRWAAQEQCRRLITKTFATVLHGCLQDVYYTIPFDDIQFPYPDIVNKFTLQQLINHKESCEDFLETLWCVNGHRDGSVFFYHYGCNHRPNSTTAGFIQGLSWQLILPYGIVRALIMSPRTCIRREGL